MASALAAAVALALCAYLGFYGLPRRLGYSQFLEMKVKQTPERGGMGAAAGWGVDGSMVRRERGSSSSSSSSSSRSSAWGGDRGGSGAATGGSGAASGGGGGGWLVERLVNGTPEPAAAAAVAAAAWCEGGGDERTPLRASRGLPRALDSSMLLDSSVLLDMEYGRHGVTATPEAAATASPTRTVRSTGPLSPPWQLHGGSSGSELDR
jgi:hypothetical protein